MMDRRRALMMAGDGNPWIDTEFDLSNFTNSNYTNHSYDATNKTLRVYTTSSRTYRNVTKSFPWQSGYEYKVSYDLQYVSGWNIAGFAENAAVRDPVGGGKVSQHVEFVYTSQAYNITEFKIFCTWSTAETGDCTISNFSIMKRRVTTT